MTDEFKLKFKEVKDVPQIIKSGSPVNKAIVEAVENSKTGSIIMEGEKRKQQSVRRYIKNEGLNLDAVVRGDDLYVSKIEEVKENETTKTGN